VSPRLGLQQAQYKVDNNSFPNHWEWLGKNYNVFKSLFILDFVDPHFAHQGLTQRWYLKTMRFFFHEMKNEDINLLKNPLVYLVGGIVIIK
jgi:hypothetical protein